MIHFGLSRQFYSPVSNTGGKSRNKTNSEIEADQGGLGMLCRHPGESRGSEHLENELPLTASCGVSKPQGTKQASGNITLRDLKSYRLERLCRSRLGKEDFATDAEAVGWCKMAFPW